MIHRSDDDVVEAIPAFVRKVVANEQTNKQTNKQTNTKMTESAIICTVSDGCSTVVL